MTLSDLAKYSMIRSVTRSLRQLSFLLFMLLEVDHGVIRSTSTGDVTANRRNMTNLLTVAMLRLSAIKIIQTKSRIIASVAYFRILVGGGGDALRAERGGAGPPPQKTCFFVPKMISLCQPFTKTDLARHGFRYSAPVVWHSLPRTVLESLKITVFKSRLKTHLFDLAHDVTTASEVTTNGGIEICILLLSLCAF